MTLRNCMAPASAPLRPAQGSSAAARLLSTLSLQVGQAVPARITEVRTLSAQERTLIQSLATSQTAGKGSALSPQNPASERPSALLTPSSLRLVTVKIQARQLALLSALPLARGDEVLVQRAGPGKLAIVSENGKPLPPGQVQKGAESGPRSPGSAALNQALREILPRLNGPSLEQQSQSLATAYPAVARQWPERESERVPAGPGPPQPGRR